MLDSDGGSCAPQFGQGPEPSQRIDVLTNNMRRTVLAVAGAALVAALAWLLWPGDGTSVTSGPGPAPKPFPSPAPKLEPIAIAARDRPTREPLSAEAADRPAALITRLSGRVIDVATRAPLADCSLRLLGHANSKEELWQHTRRNGPVVWTEPPAVVTGSDGRFQILVSPPPPYRFKLHVEPQNRGRVVGSLGPLEAGVEKDLGDIEVPVTMAVRGRVVDTRGTAVADHEVELSTQLVITRSSFAKFRHRARPATTAVDGSFTIQLVPGTYDIWVKGRQVVSPRTKRLRPRAATVADAESFEIVVTHPDDIATIAGRFVDTAGVPVAGVNIKYHVGKNRSLRFAPQTTEDGVFRVEHKLGDDAAPIALRAHRKGYEAWDTAEPIPWGTEGLEIVLTACLPVELLVIDALTRKPIESYGLRYFRPQSCYVTWHTVVREAGQHRGGLVTLDSVRHGAWRLVVEPMSSAWLPSAVIAVDHRGQGMPQLTVELYPRRSRVVQVVFADNSPVVGSRVDLLTVVTEPSNTPDFLIKPISARTRKFRLGEHGFRGAELLVDEGRTDTRGEVELRAAPDRDVTLRLLGPGHQVVILPGLRWQASAPPMRIVVAAGARLVGSIGPRAALAALTPRRPIVENYPPGEHRDRVLVSHTPQLSLARWVDGRSQRFPELHQDAPRLPPGGSYEITGIPAGIWQVTLSHRDWSSFGQSTTHSRYLGSVALSDGATTQFDAQIESPGRATLTGTVSRNGVPCRNTRGTLIRWALEPSRHRIGNYGFQTDDTGEFTRELEPGHYTLGLYADGPRRPYAQTSPATVAIEVVDGEQRAMQFEIWTAALTLHVTAADSGQPVAGIRLGVRGQGFAWQRRTEPTDANGRVSIGAVPVGTLAVTAGAQAIVLGTVSVPRSGCTAELTLRRQ